MGMSTRDSFHDLDGGFSKREHYLMLIVPPLSSSRLIPLEGVHLPMWLFWKGTLDRG